MALVWTWLALPGILAFVLALTAGVFVLRSAPDRAVNRRLPPVLLVESSLSLGAAIIAIATPFGAAEVDPRVAWVDNAIGVALSALPLLYLRFLATLETPLVSWLRERRVDRALVALLPIGLVALALEGRADVVSNAIGLVFVVGGLLGTGILGIVASISLYRRAEPGSARRTRARWYAAAFISRDILLASLLVAQIGVGSAIGTGYYDSVLIPAIFAPLAIIVYVPLIAYGALKANLFDLDLRVKVGIRRSTVVTAILVVALAAAKTAEFYLNRTYGWTAGAIAAGAMLVLAPRLNRMGDKVANVAMPRVQPTTGYVQFKKLEVYKAAVETSIETGGIDARERVKLDKLREKLALDPADADAVEAEVGAPA